MLGLSRAPSPGMDEAALLSCIAWVAHGFEIVQSIFPGWKFAPPDAVIVDGHPLAAGEIVSTGTLTRALPVTPGETWTTALKGIALEGATLRFC